MQFKLVIFKELLVLFLRKFTVNKAGEVSDLYKYCLCCLWPLQLVMDDYNEVRINQLELAKIKWQKGQLENYLNAKFDPVNEEIFIDETSFDYTYLYDIDYFNSSPVQDYLDNVVFFSTIGEESDQTKTGIMLYGIDERIVKRVIVNINLPSLLYNDIDKYNEIDTIINKLILLNIDYTIKEIV